MSLDHLWAGWRSSYVASFATGRRLGPAAGSTKVVPDGECIFCAILAAEVPDRERLVVWSGDTAVAVLNAYPYATGHVMVMPRRHLSELDELTKEESSELWAALEGAVRALKSAYGPEGLNIGANFGRAAGAGIPGHLHLHAVPRWVGDTNFMTSVAGTRVLPESLEETWEKLSSAWR